MLWGVDFLKQFSRYIVSDDIVDAPQRGPQKALRGVIPAPFLEPFCGKLLSKVDKPDGN